MFNEQRVEDLSSMFMHGLSQNWSLEIMKKPSPFKILFELHCIQWTVNIYLIKRCTATPIWIFLRKETLVSKVASKECFKMDKNVIRQHDQLSLMQLHGKKPCTYLHCGNKHFSYLFLHFHWSQDPCKLTFWICLHLKEVC